MLRTRHWLQHVGLYQDAWRNATLKEIVTMTDAELFNVQTDHAELLADRP